jgi:cytochrome c peroxidase
MNWRTLPIALVPVMMLAGPAAAETFTVTMAGMTYAPAMVTARVGDTLRFVNDDTVNHDIFVPTVGHAVHLGTQQPAVERLLVLGKAGTFLVECGLHPHMSLVVEVLP